MHDCLASENLYETTKADYSFRQREVGEAEKHLTLVNRIKADDAIAMLNPVRTFLLGGNATEMCQNVETSFFECGCIECSGCRCQRSVGAVCMFGFRIDGGFRRR